MSRIVVLDPMSEARLARLAAFLPEGFSIATSASRAPEDQLAAIRRADLAIVADVPVTARMIHEGAAGGLRAVQKWGVGYDGIDCDAARAVGIRVMRTTGSNAVAVAETALAMMLALNRNVVRGHVGMLDGKWLKPELGSSSMMLSGKTVGIVGFGHIGQQVARLLAGFGCPVLYTKRTPLADGPPNARPVTLDELLAQSDVVTLHCDLNPQTRGMIDAAALARMKPGSLLVNLARGGIVVERDLADAVQSGHLRGAAVDVFETEPAEAGNPLIGLDRVIVTPHVGGKRSLPTTDCSA